MMTIKNYVRAQSLHEAYELNQKKRNRIIGGMLWMKMTKLNVDTAIDLCDLGLDTIEETDEFFAIGAMATLRQLELHPGLNDYTGGAMAESVKHIVGVQFRNTATVGGSVYGRFGFSDVLTMLLSLDCQVELYNAGIMPLEEFVKAKKDRDVLVRVIVKKTPGKFVYTSMRNTRTDFPVIACAVSEVDGEYRAVIGARPAVARIVRDAEGILAGGVNEESAKAFASYVANSLPTGSNIRGSAAYRKHLIRVLTDRALMELGGAK